MDNTQTSVKKFFSEPLLHFLLLGIVLFVAYDLMQKPGVRSGKDEIVVTMGQVENLATIFAKTWQRPPTPEELAGLVRSRVKDEVYYREALALGLDKDDTVVRRRLRQKMEFISDDIVDQVEPSDEELNAYLEAHPEAFKVLPSITFLQVFLDPSKRGENLESAAAQLLDQLNRASVESDLSSLGDSLMIENKFSATSLKEIQDQFGETFSTQLLELAPGHWQGPIESSFGVHLVFISERTDSRLPALEEVRDAVQREWENARRLELNEKFYQELLTHYTVTIEGLEPGVDTQANETK